MGRKNRNRKNRFNNRDEDNSDKEDNNLNNQNNSNNSEDSEDEVVNNFIASKFQEKKENINTQISSKQNLFKLALKYDKENNTEQAIKYYKQSIQEENKAVSMYNLALLLEKTDRNESYKYYKMAVDKKKYKEAMINLGYLYLEDDDFINAYKYFRMAVENGDYENLYNMSLSLNKSGISKYINKAREIFKIFTMHKELETDEIDLFNQLFIQDNNLFNLD
jgi:TPR repeat protein